MNAKELFDNKFKEYSEEFNITETCMIIKNVSDEQIVYEVTDENNDSIIFDFNVNTAEVSIIVDSDDIYLLRIDNI